MILATSNGIGMGHLARASAIARVLKEEAEVIVVSMAAGVAELPESLGLRVEYIPGRDRNLMPRSKWDRYLKDRLVTLIDETGASLLAFDGVVPYPGVIAAKDARPSIKLVWVRRGLWQWKPSRHLLSLQSRLMDHIVEPGDFARVFDTGPTSMRNDAHLTAPISLYQPRWAMDRSEARRILGIDPHRPAILVQLGTGDGDVNEKMHAALLGLVGWRDLQVILTKNPTDTNGKSLAPAGLDLKVIRYFPLADLLHAFDGAVAAAGYNGVHELLPACLPTVFVPNIRGTDDQASRARWTHEQGFALTADQDDLTDITAKVRMLQDESLRERLASACRDLPAMTGNEEATRHYLNMIRDESHHLGFKVNYFRYLLRTQALRRIRSVGIASLRVLAIAYRTFFPRLDVTPEVVHPVTFSEETRAHALMTLIKSDAPLEHMIMGASRNYRMRRRSIAGRSYRTPLAEDAGDFDLPDPVTPIIEESI